MKLNNGWLDEAIEIDYGAKSMSRQGYKPTHIVLHGTAGGSSAQGIANYFATSTVQASAHIIIGQDGILAQGISCDVAAWGKLHEKSVIVRQEGLCIQKYGNVL